MTPTYGELFAGYNGLGMGVQSVLGGEMAWCSEFDPAPSKILAHHWPDVPNHGDITRIDWTKVEPVDVLTGGSPCQDLSIAGRGAGMRPGTRSGLWSSMAHAIDIIRPRLVIWENVRGALSAEAASGMEPCPGCLGGADDGPVLRALGRVLGDLADLGYDASWYGLRAADVGAAHGRFRAFVFATQRGDDLSWLPADDWGARGHAAGGVTLLPTPRVTDGNGAGLHGDGGMDLRTTVSLLPTPRATDGTNGGPNQRGSSGDLMLPSAVSLLPTPTATPYGNNQSPSDGAAVRPSLDSLTNWGAYAAAIARHGQALGRPAPSPTETGPRGRQRLSPAFVEWLMMLPAGHVTDPVIGITRNEQLRALGNGVVPAQAAAATRAFIHDTATWRVA